MPYLTVVHMLRFRPKHRSTLLCPRLLILHTCTVLHSKLRKFVKARSSFPGPKGEPRIEMSMLHDVAWRSKPDPEKHQFGKVLGRVQVVNKIDVHNFGNDL